MTLTQNVASKLVVGFVAVSMLFSLSFQPAQAAMTTAEIQAEIAKLMQTVNALQAQLGQTTTTTTTTTSGTTGGTCPMFTMDLTMGKTGAEVTALQNFLIGKGHAIAAGATGMFGAQTKAALVAFQSANGITPAAGYFGPVTRAKVASMCAPATTGGTTTGGTTTGGTTTTTGDLEGGAGSVDQYKLVSSLSNEEVGEDEKDVEVAGLEIEVDESSDIEITAVRLVFNEGTANQDFDEYADEVSVWLGTEEVARVEASDFNDDNDWTKTVSLKDAVIRAGKTDELVVAVSGISSLDGTDVGETWTVDFTQVRFEDADGATISEDPLTAVRTFSFQTFAVSSNVEMKIADGDADVNESRTIEVDATNDTDDVEVLSFTLEAEGDSDLEVRDFGVNVDVTGAAHTDDVITSLALFIDGKEVATADCFDDADCVDAGADEDYIFEDVDTVIKAGDTADVVIKANFFSIADDLDEGDTVSFTLGETETDQATLVKVQDESGENVADADLTGSVSSGSFDLRSAGIKVKFVSASQTVTADDGADNDTGTFKLVFDVTGFGNTVYVSDDAVATTATSITAETVATDGMLYFLETDGAGTIAASSTESVTYTDQSGNPTDATNGIELGEGETARVTLTVFRTNAIATDDGAYRTLLKGIGWNTDNSTTFNVYDFDLEDFKTDSISLN